MWKIASFNQSCEFQVRSKSRWCFLNSFCNFNPKNNRWFWGAICDFSIFTCQQFVEQHAITVIEVIRSLASASSSMSSVTGKLLNRKPVIQCVQRPPWAWRICCGRRDRRSERFWWFCFQWWFQVSNGAPKNCSCFRGRVCLVKPCNEGVYFAFQK